MPKSIGTSYRWLQRLAVAEAGSLLVLLAIAVPLKHLFNQPGGVSIMGPVHGTMFLAYVWLTVSTATRDGWPAKHLASVLLAGFIPFGGLWVARKLRLDDLSSTPAASRPS